MFILSAGQIQVLSQQEGFNDESFKVNLVMHGGEHLVGTITNGMECEVNSPCSELTSAVDVADITVMN